jgi:hypothetical protein
MSSLREALESLAAGFAIDLVRAIQGSSLVELHREVAGTSKRERPLAQGVPLRAVGQRSQAMRQRRRSFEDIASALDRVVDTLRSQPSGLRAEQIRSMLHMQAKEMPRVLSEGLDQGKLRREGRKRATTYFAT